MNKDLWKEISWYKMNTSIWVKLRILWSFAVSIHLSSIQIGKFKTYHEPMINTKEFHNSFSRYNKPIHFLYDPLFAAIMNQNFFERNIKVRVENFLTLVFFISPKKI